MDYSLAHLRVIDDNGETHQSADAIHTVTSRNGSVDTKNVKYNVMTNQEHGSLEPTGQSFSEQQKSLKVAVDQKKVKILNLVKNKTVPIGDTLRSIKTLPYGLVIKESGVLPSENGVFTTICISDGTNFGPYEGEIIDESLFVSSSR